MAANNPNNWDSDWTPPLVPLPMAADGVPVTMLVVFNVNSYQVYPLCTSVGKFSTERDCYISGEITAMTSTLTEEPGPVQTTYTVYYEDGELKENLTHEQITEGIRNKP